MSSAAGNIKLKAIFGLGPIPIREPQLGGRCGNLGPRLLQKRIIPAADLPACNLGHQIQTQAIHGYPTHGPYRVENDVCKRSRKAPI